MTTATQGAIDTAKARDQFRAALLAAGIEPPEHIEADGKLHRCNTTAKNGRDDAAYVLHLDGLPAGGYENHQDGAGWQRWQANIGRPYTAAETNAYKSRIEEGRKQREAEAAQRRAKAKNESATQWAEAVAAQSHPYLQRKGIAAHGLRVSNGSLLVPMRDTEGELHSLQTIAADGTKRFQTGGRKQGCFFTIGEIPAPDGILCIVEGFATGASVHEATGYAVAVAFDAGNLLPVAQALHEKHPAMRLAICADDDYQTEGNTGLTKGHEAAKTVGAVLVVPDFGNTRPYGATDFNDLHQAQGLDAVADCVQVALACKPEPAKASSSTSTAPSAKDKTQPQFCDYGGGRFELSAQGVYFHGTDKDGNEQPPKWVCSPLAVIAKTRDNASGEWGRLLEWQDSDGVAHRWAMPLELLQGDGLEVRRELVRLGLHIGASKAARDLLATYLQVWPIEQRARCVERLGWHGGVYVTPSEAVGETDEITVFQNSNAIEPALFTAGTLEGWRETVGSMAAGNSRLMFALCVAFAAPLADVVGEDSGGFHLRGASSSGKSTALKLAASIWGNPAKYPRLWRATANGLEGLAALHNDGLLILDELSQIDPREAGEAAYLLANGQGKTRAGKTGAARKSASWRLLFLSAGEETLAAMMGKAGKSANAGQEIRLADIEADAGAGMGAFEHIHQSETPAAFALALKDAASAHHGAAGMEWLRCIVQDRADIAGMASGALAQFVQAVCPPQVSGQAQRVARRFALVAFAGELASHYGITGWQQDQATGAVKKCFAAWLDGFGGGGNKEGRALLEQVRAFIELHGASRFEELGTTHTQRVPNRAGFIRTNEAGQREYLVLPEVFKRELCKGFSLNAACKELQGAGWLLTKEATRYTQKPRLPEIGATRVYVLGAGVLEGE